MRGAISALAADSWEVCIPFGLALMRGEERGGEERRGEEKWKFEEGSRFVRLHYFFLDLLAAAFLVPLFLPLVDLLALLRVPPPNSSNFFSFGFFFRGFFKSLWSSLSLS